VLTGKVAYNTTGKVNNTNVEFEIQVCQVVKSKDTKCKATSPVNQINLATQECIAVGDITTTAWDQSPSKGGVYVTYYHGDTVDPVIHRSARIYFSCDKTVDIGAPIFEHVTPCGQYHFGWLTKHACY